MKSSETAPTKLLLGTAAASLAALGIAFVATTVPAPTATVEHEIYDCRLPIRSPAPPTPAPIEVDLGRPLAPASK